MVPRPHAARWRRRGHPTWAQSQQAGGGAQQRAGHAGHVGHAAPAPAGGHVPPATAAPAAAPEGGGWALESRYELLGKIGEGTYGVVYLATARGGPRTVYAIKKFKTGRVRAPAHPRRVPARPRAPARRGGALCAATRPRPRWRAQEGDGISPTAVREILLLRELRHEHIVSLSAVHVDRREPSLSLAFEYAEHDLYEIIWHHRDRLAGPIDPYVVKSLMWQLLNGLSYLHQNWIIHRDLKPSNVLVMGEGPEAGVVKVADFGLARFFQAPLRPLSDNGVVVTIWYRPPELLLGGRHYTRAVDMWGAGCIFAELLTLRPLFQGSERKQAGAPYQGDQVDRIFRVLGHPSPRAWPHLEQLPHWADNTENVRVPRPEWGAARLQAHLSEALRHLGDAFARAGGGVGRPAPPPPPKLTPAGLDLLQRMLAYDPLQRISAEEALAHPFFDEAPRPGPNAFVCAGRRVASYPRRHKQTVFPTTAPPGGAAAPDAGGGGSSAAQRSAPAAAAARQQPQQQQAQQQQQQQPQAQQRGGAAGAAGGGSKKRKADGGSGAGARRGAANRTFL
ncbi:CDKE-1 [Scenedesmus sp. PABB004]|nr:CDKE-1 [Scenedesmus sp. PABB004]